MSDETEKKRPKARDGAELATTPCSAGFDGAFHAEVEATMKSNGWDYPYTLGFCHGKDDAINSRESEFRVPRGACDDFEKGYHKGYDEYYHPMREVWDDPAWNGEYPDAD